MRRECIAIIAASAWPERSYRPNPHRLIDEAVARRCDMDYRITCSLPDGDGPRWWEAVIPYLKERVKENEGLLVYQEFCGKVATNYGKRRMLTVGLLTVAGRVAPKRSRSCSRVRLTVGEAEVFALESGTNPHAAGTRSVCRAEGYKRPIGV